MAPTRLSPHFTLAEFIASRDATRFGIDNSLPAALIPNALRWATMMERIRAALSAKLGREAVINLSSGYRCLTLNRRENSADTSDHVQGLAGDWRCDSFGMPTEICRFLAPRVDDLGIGQLINEYPDRNGWVHTSEKMVANPINRIITINGFGTHAGILEK